ncbi:amidase [Bordetella sp. 15P40C-2]|uniref:amidase n=1 Tax=Bordetella sp. 15P40C-2 TaxID=2572246 RepID=UPI001366270B
MSYDQDALRDLSLCEVVRLLDEGAVSAERLTQTAIDAAQSDGHRLNCILSLEADAALAQSREIDKARSAGHELPRLAGVPMAHKDVFARNGAAVTCGSPLLRDFRPAGRADALANLEEAGSITFASLHLSEFIRSPMGYNPHLGPCRNPWNPEHVSGGSSSGSAAAVAVGIGYGSLGTDTGGSVRIPASMCGLVGIKPTHSRISTRGVTPLSWSLDAVGPIARTAADCAMMLDALKPRFPMADLPASFPAETIKLNGLRIGVVSAWMDELEESPAACLKEAGRVLASLGAQLSSVQLQQLDLLDACQEIVRETEAATVHSRYLRAQPLDYSDEVRWRTEPGFFRFATEYADILRLRASLLDEFLDHAFAQVDYLLTPTIPAAAPAVLVAYGDDTDLRKRLVGSLSRYTRVFNFLGLPALTVPCGFDDGGLPVGMQLIGRPFAERRLLGIAHAYQNMTEWHLARPQALKSH